MHVYFEQHPRAQLPVLARYADKLRKTTNWSTWTSIWSNYKSIKQLTRPRRSKDRQLTLHWCMKTMLRLVPRDLLWRWWQDREKINGGRVCFLQVKNIVLSSMPKENAHFNAVLVCELWGISAQVGNGSMESWLTSPVDGSKKSWSSFVLNSSTAAELTERQW